MPAVKKGFVANHEKETEESRFPQGFVYGKVSHLVLMCPKPNEDTGRSSGHGRAEDKAGGHRPARRIRREAVKIKI
jgi:hypothetical protein